MCTLVHSPKISIKLLMLFLVSAEYLVTANWAVPCLMHANHIT